MKEGLEKTYVFFILLFLIEGSFMKMPYGTCNWDGDQIEILIKVGLKQTYLIAKILHRYSSKATCYIYITNQ